MSLLKNSCSRGEEAASGRLWRDKWKQFGLGDEGLAAWPDAFCLAFPECPAMSEASCSRDHLPV